MDCLEYYLRPALLDDLRIVLTWVKDARELKLWGGPALTFPGTAERIWVEISAESQNTFTLIDSGGNVAGFGQTIWREPDTVHLGRIMVARALRGKGLGRNLCEKLIQAGSIRYRPAKFTLNVYKCNSAAYNLYTRLGFRELSEDPEQQSVKMCLPFEPEPTKPSIDY